MKANTATVWQPRKLFVRLNTVLQAHPKASVLGLLCDSKQVHSQGSVRETVPWAPRSDLRSRIVDWASRSRGIVQMLGGCWPLGHRWPIASNDPNQGAGTGQRPRGGNMHMDFDRKTRGYLVLT
jgi:hypothetical protein